MNVTIILVEPLKNALTLLVHSCALPACLVKMDIRETTSPKNVKV